jgi:plasmid stabilization system protein ParE
VAKRTAEFLAAFADEYVAAYYWHAERSGALALRLIAETERAIAEVLEHPERYRRYFRGTRRVPLRTFRYLLVYRASSESVLFIAFAHASRKPGYWHDRL